jgi:fluoride exporter
VPLDGLLKILGDIVGGDRLQRYLLIAVGGALGAIARYEIGVLAAERFGVRFSLGTLIINISACFLIGFSLEFLNRHTNINPAWRYLVPIGFIGAYSTFSTFEWEIYTDFTSGAFWIGVTYMVASIVAGLVAVALGVSTARSVA